MAIPKVPAWWEADVEAAEKSKLARMNGRTSRDLTRDINHLCKCTGKVDDAGKCQDCGRVNLTPDSTRDAEMKACGIDWAS